MLNNLTFKGFIIAAALVILFGTMSMIGFSIWIGFPVMNLQHIPPFFEVLFVFCAVSSVIIIFFVVCIAFSKIADITGAILGTALIRFLKVTYKISTRLKLIK
ncbi:MAG TPA: hypothetical protein VN420_05755 [Candidatus Fimivivens sp.]|nr:hypothetical protein [Candidatus Fimivivens sp.]